MLGFHEAISVSVTAGLYWFAPALSSNVLQDVPQRALQAKLIGMRGR
jgi:hypothetical protein